MDWTLVDAFRDYVSGLDGKDQMELVRCLGSLGGILLTLYLAMGIVGKATKWVTLSLYKGTKFVSVKSFRLLFPEKKLSQVCTLILSGMDRAKEGRINIFTVNNGRYTLLTDNAAFVDFLIEANVSPSRISPVTRKEGQYALVNSLDVLDAEERALVFDKLKEVYALWQKQTKDRTRTEAENLHRIGLLPPAPITSGPQPVSPPYVPGTYADGAVCSVSYIPPAVMHVGTPPFQCPNDIPQKNESPKKNESPEKNEKPFII